MTDARLGVRYTVTPDTAWLLRYIMREARAERVIARAARHKHLDAAVVRRSLYTLLGYLNTIGGVRVVHPVREGITTLRLRFSWRGRYPLTMSGFSLAIARAYGMLITVLTGVWCVMCVVYGMPLWWALLPSAVLISCILHEAGHAAMVRFSRVPGVMLASFGNAAIVYARPRRVQQQFIAAAGPIGAAIPYLIASCLPIGLPYRCIAAAVAAVHLCSLLPYFADGKTLWRDL